MGKDSPQPTPSSQNVTQTSIPDYAKPYVERMLGKAEAVSSQPYQSYGGERLAGFSPMQQQAFQGVQNLQPSQQLGTATQMAGLAGLGSLQAGQNYRAQTFDNAFDRPQEYNPMQMSGLMAQAPNLQQYQMGPAQQVRTGSFTQPGSAEAYMSPYIQNALEPQMREAERRSAILGQQNQSQAVQQGAFGGSRSAIIEAERQRNLGQEQSDIYGRGMQSAYASAQQQFNAEQQARLAAQQANQQAGLTVGGQNLQSLLGVQQLGSGQSMQSQLANQQAYQQALQQQEQSRQFGYGQNLNAAQLAAQYGLSGQQAAEQSRQFGSTLGLQGLGQAGQMAGQLGNLGQAQFGQQKDIINALSTAGGQQQGLEQQRLSQQYQDFLTQRGYPQQQLSYMSDMLRGLPLSQSTQSTYQAPPSALTQIAGAGLTAKGLGMFNEGGSVGQPAGLADLALMRMGG
jgi:hypothetical protein